MSKQKEEHDQRNQNLRWHEVAIPNFFRGAIAEGPQGVREAVRGDGKTVWQGYAVLSVDDFEEELTTDIFVVVEEADGKSFVAIGETNAFPVYALTAAAAEARVTSAALARERMTEFERSPNDMFEMTISLVKERDRRYALRQDEQNRAARERRMDEEALELYKKVERGREVAQRKATRGA